MKKFVSMFLSLTLVLLMTSGFAAEAAESVGKVQSDSITDTTASHDIQSNEAVDITATELYRSYTGRYLRLEMPESIKAEAASYEIISEDGTVIDSSWYEYGNNILVSPDDFESDTKYNLQVVVKNAEQQVIALSNIVKVNMPAMITDETILLQEDMTIDNSLIFYGGQMNLNGHKLTVNGDFTFPGGILILGNGQLEVMGDYIMRQSYIDYPGSIVYGVSSGQLKMTNPYDYILVHGDFITQNYAYNNQNYINSGIIEVEGDFYQYGSKEDTCFNCTGDNKVILSGDEAQTVILESSKSIFNILELNNSSEEGVIFNTYVRYNELISNNTKYAFNSEAVSGWKLEKDEVYEGDLLLGGDELNLNGYTLNVKGNLMHMGGTINVNGGKLIVDGDYKMQSKDGTAATAVLKMINPNDYVLVNGDVVSDLYNGYSNSLTAGTLEVKGNLVLKARINSTDKFTVLLSGKTEQEVDLNGSNISNLVINNTSAEGVIVSKTFNVTKSFKNENSKVTNGRNIILTSGARIFGSQCNNDVTVSGGKLESDVHIVGTCYTSNGFDLNGYTLKVDGDLFLSSGQLYINTGDLIVGGDFRMESVAFADDGTMQTSYSNGSLKMTDTRDYVCVNGDFIDYSNVSHKDILTAGILEIKGDFNEKLYKAGDNFTCANQHKVILSGDKHQQVSFESTNCRFNILELKNASSEGVAFKTEAYYNSFIPNDSKYTFEIGYTEGWTLSEDEIYEGNFLLSDGDLNLNGHTLTVKGNVVQTGGTMNINGGELVVEGSYRIQSADGNQGANAYLKMTKSTDSVVVFGDFVMQSNYDHSSYLTSGTLEVQENVSRISGSDSNFNSSGDFLLVLNGNEKQVIDISGDKSRVNSLKITNSSPEGVEFSNYVYISKMLYQTDSILKNSYYISLCNTCKIENAVWKYDLSTKNYSMSMPMHIYGDFYINDGVNLNGNLLTVDGNCVLSSGTLFINRGHLEVGKDFRLELCTFDADGSLKYSSGNGILSMQNSEDYIKVSGALIIHTYIKDYGGYLIAGTIEVKGDINELEWSNIYGFYGMKDHKVVLSGEEQQRIAMQSGAIRFGTLILNNSSSEGVIISPLLGYDQFIPNNSKYAYESGGVIGWKLDEDEAYDGDLRLSGGELDLNGHSLTVKGNLIQNGGCVKINGGRMTVEGNYTISSSNNISDEPYLSMMNSNDNVIVYGDFEFNGNYAKSEYLKDGVLDVRGNVTSYDVALAGKLTLLLSGSEKQTVNAREVGILKITNTSIDGVDFARRVLVNRSLVNTDSVINNSHNICLQSGATVEGGVWNHDITLCSDTVLTADLHIKGSLYLSEYTLNLNGHNLKVDNDCVLNSGVIIVNTGRLEVGRDLRLQSVGFNYDGSCSYGASGGMLKMNNKEDYVVVNGSFIYEVNKSYQNYLTDGTLEIKGEFEILQGYYGFLPVGNHKVLLSGDAVQTVSFASLNSKFNILELQNSSSGGVLFNEFVNYAKLISNQSKYEYISGEVINWTLDADETYDGNLSFGGGTIDLNGRTLTVKGDITQFGGNIIANGGHLIIEGNYIMNGSSLLTMTNTADIVSVHGDFIVKSSVDYTNYLTAGRLEVKGNVNILNSDDFISSNQFTLVLNGDKGQNILGGRSIQLGNLEVANTSKYGVTFMSFTFVKGSLKNISGVIHNGYFVYICYLSKPEGEWNGDLRLVSELKLENDFRVKGDFILQSGVDLNGHILTVDGNAYFGDGTLSVNKGKLLIGKDLLYKRCDINNGVLAINEYSAGILKMIYPEDYVCVDGDLVLYINEQSKINAQNEQLTSGVLEVHGDIEGHEAYPFLPGGTHKILLNGSNKQNISFASSKSKLNILEINKPLETGYKFDSDSRWTALIERVEDNESPSAPGNLHDVEKTVSSISLEWDESTDNLGVSGYDVYRNGLRIGTSSKPAFTDTGLKSDTEYTYYIIAFDSVGNRSDSSNVFTEKTNIDENPPTEPQYLQIWSKNNSSVSLMWSKSSDDGSVEYYAVYRNGNKIGIVLTTEYTDMNLEPGNYTYTVKAVDNVGNYSLDSNLVAFDNLAPEAPVLIVGEISDGSVVLSWTMEDTSDVKGYRVYKNGNLRADTTAMSFTETSVLPDTKYIFSVESYDAAGNVSAKSVSAAVYTGADITPPEVNASVPARVSEKVSINASANDDLGVESFMLQYSTDGESWTDIQNYPTDFCAVWEDCEFNWNVASIAEGNVILKVSAADRSGNVGSKIITTYIDHTAPAPVILSVNENMQLKWDNSKDADFSYYSVYRSEAGKNKYIIINDKMGYTYFRDIDALTGKKYDYAVVCVDTAGNRSEYSNSVTIELANDTNAPVITSVSPADGNILHAQQTFGVYCQDDVRLKMLTVDYQLDGESAWEPVYSGMLEQNSGYIWFDFNTEKLVLGNYTFRFIVEDAAGNKSEPYLCKYIYTVDSDLIAPILTVIPGAWKNELSWTAASESDMVTYYVYRKEQDKPLYRIFTTKDTVYTDKSVTAGTVYEYMVEAVDINGRKIESGLVSGTASNDDDEMPIANAGNDVETVVNRSVSFDGSLSRDNHKIMSYLWDFGDGSISREAKPNHIYTNGGTYRVTLTVTDDAGNQASDSLIALIRDDNYSYITINVRDKTGNALPDTMICCDIPESNVTECTTDKNGVVKLVIKNGKYPLCFYKEGYEPVRQEISTSADSNFYVTLSPKELVTGELNVNRLELNDIEKLGVDVNDPDNQFVFEYKAEISLYPDGEMQTFRIISNGKGELINTQEKIIWNNSSSQGSNVGTAYFKAIPNENHPEVPPTIVMFNISWLKEFFEVEMTVINNADATFPIENAAATLNLPDGLSLPSANKTQTIDVVSGKSSKTCSWLVRGDKSGSYNIEADFTGMLMPFNVPVTAKFVTDEPIVVYGGNALKLDMIYRVTDDMTGIEYAEFELTNVSDIDIHNVCVNLAGMITENNVDEIHLEYPSGLLEVIKWSPNGQEGESIIFLPALYGEDADYSRTLKPGQKLRGLLIIKKR